MTRHFARIGADGSLMLPGAAWEQAGPLPAMAVSSDAVIRDLSVVLLS